MDIIGLVAAALCTVIAAALGNLVCSIVAALGSQPVLASALGPEIVLTLKKYKININFVDSILLVYDRSSFIQILITIFVMFCF